MLVLFMVFILLLFLLVIIVQLLIVDHRYSKSVIINKKTLITTMKDIYIGKPDPHKIKNYINDITLTGNNVYSNDKALIETSGLIIACKKTEALLVNAMYDINTYSKTKQIINFIYDNLDKKINISTKHLPYGNNWYEFSIGIPLLYVTLLIIAIKRNDSELDSMIQRYCTQILRINTRPNKSYFSICRDGPNAAMMGYTYWISKIMTDYKFNKFDFYNNPSTELILKLYYGSYVTEGEGMYADGTFIFHTNVRAYGYAIMLFRMLWFYDYMVGNSVSTSIRKERIWFCLKNIIHPTIPMIGSTIINRTGEHLCLLSVKNNITLPHMAFMTIGSILSYMSVDFTIQYMCATKRWAAYETKRQEDRLYYVNVLGRRLLTRESSEKIINGEEMFEPGVVFYDPTNYRPSIYANTEDVQSYFLEDGWSFAKRLDNVMITVSYQKYNVYLNSLVITIITPLGLINTIIFHKEFIRSTNAALCINSGTLDETTNKIDGTYNKMHYINTNTQPTMKSLQNNRIALMCVFGTNMYVVGAKLNPDTESHIVMIYSTTPYKEFNEKIKIIYTNLNIKTNKQIVYTFEENDKKYNVIYNLNDFKLDNKLIPVKNDNNLQMNRTYQ